MSSQLKEAEREETGFYSNQALIDSSKNHKVNLNELVNRLNLEKKKERKQNIILSVGAVSAVAIFGVILTLWVFLNIFKLYELRLLKQLNKID